MNQANYMDGIRSLANLYSPSIFRQILEQDNLSTIQRRITKYKGILVSNQNEIRFESFLKMLYEEMSKNYRNEYVYKNAVINQLLLSKYKLNTTTLLNEYKIGKSIADVILVNGEVKLFEIKTDLDNLNRLDGQLEEYKKAVEKIHIVTNSKNILALKKLYQNSNYGLIEFTEDNKLTVHEEAIEDKSSFDYKTIFKLLRKEEYLTILKNKIGFVPTSPNTLIYRECLKKVSEIDVEVFQKNAFEQLKRRTITKPELLEDIQTPYELKYLCYTLDLDIKQYDRLFHLLKKSV